ncbi:uncharacterized protein LOC144471339 [Augochlora pura]
MAPRKIVRSADSEVIDMAAEAGDLSQPKMKKTVTKSANKNDKEKAAKPTKVAEIETVKPDSNTSTAKTASTKKKHKQAEENTVTKLAKTENADHSEVVAAKKKNQVNTEAAAKLKMNKKKALDSIEQEGENVVAKEEMQSDRSTPMIQRLRSYSNKNKEKTAVQTKLTRTHGKAAKHNVNDKLTDVMQKVQEKTAIEMVMTTKKGRGRKGAATTKETGDTTETAVSNNNVQKPLDENDKKDNFEKQDIKPLEMAKQGYEATVKDEEDNAKSAVIEED